MARTLLRKLNQYSEEFKATAVGLSSLPGVLIQDVASSLDIHPFMLSRWRKEVREGKIVAKRVRLEPQRKAELKRLREVERRYKMLQEEHEILKKGHPVCFRNRAQHSITIMCRLYAVTRAGYYAWRHRRPSARSEENERLLTCNEHAHAQSHEAYGSPRIQRALCVQGERVSRNRVARLMRKHQIRARAPRIYRTKAGVHRFFEAIPKQRLKALALHPNAVWVGDITYLKLGNAWRYWRQ